MSKKLNIPVLNFETYLSDQLILDAEQCYDNGAIESIELSKNGLWKVSIRNKKLHTVYIRVHEGKIFSGECDCDTKQNGDMCMHQVCAFFGIRHSESEKKEEKTKTSVYRKKINDHVKKLISQVDDKKLKQFVSTYSGKDKAFKLMLTVHFARHTEFDDKGKLYKDLLDDCFPVKSETSSKNYLPEARLLHKIGKEILTNYKDALSLEAFTEAFQMISALQMKIAYALHILTKENKNLFSLEQTVHSSYKELIDDRLAPALKHEIILTMMESMNLSFYKYQGEDNLYELILKAAPTIEQNHHYQSILAFKIEGAKDFSEKAFLMSFLFYSIFNTGKKPRADLKNIGIDSFLLIECLDQMIDRGFINEASKTLNYFKKTGKLDEKIYLRFMLRFASLKNDHKEALHISMHLFKLDYDLKYIKFIKEHSGENWHKTYIEIRDDLIASKENLKFNLALSLAEKEGDLPTIAHLLKEKNDINYYLKFDRKLVKEYVENIYEFYRIYLINYLEGHAGDKASERVVSILNHLYIIGLHKVSQKISKELLEIYPQRRNLKEYLNSGKVATVQKL